MIDKPRKVKEWKFTEKMPEDKFSGEASLSISQGFINEEKRKRLLVGAGSTCFRVNVEEGLWLGAEQFDNAQFSVDMEGNALINYGSNIEIKEGGYLNFTSVTAPGASTATLVTTGTGNVDNGAHIYKITFISSSGETQIGTASNTVTVDGTHKQVALSAIPVSSSNSVTARKIYRTKAGASLYYYLDEITDNSTTTYTDNIADASLGVDIYNDKQNTTIGGIKIDGSYGMRVFGKNCLFGIGALESITIGNANTAVGWSSGNSITTGSSNVALGFNTGASLTTGALNIGIGSNALASSVSGTGNTVIGSDAMSDSTSGDYNVAIGEDALSRDSAGAFTGSNNVAIGTGAGFEIAVAASANVLIGYQAGKNFTLSNALIIENSDNITTPLIYGDFSADQLKWHACTGSPHQSKTLGNGATTMAITRDVVIVTGDGGGNTLATITGGVDGQVLKLIFVDALVVITDDDTHAANSCDLSAAFTSADDKTLQLVYDGTNWYELSRSIN